ncbi:MAG: type II secretion system F family protein [Candidatus Thermoplasmatota archaeon]
MSLTEYERFCSKIFRKKALEFVEKDEKLSNNIVSARILLRPEDYVSYVWFTSILIASVGLFFLLTISLTTKISFIIFILLFFLILSITMLIYIIFMILPERIVRRRAKEIDARLPYAASYIASISIGDPNPETLINKIAKLEVYGDELRKEFLWIYRDIKLFGDDIVTALQKGIMRSPSIRLKEFLQGIVTVITSAGNLREYFLMRGKEYMSELSSAQKKATDELGSVAECFVALGVATPLLFILTFSLLAIVVEGGQLILLVLIYGFILIWLPAIAGLCIYGIKASKLVEEI